MRIMASRISSKRCGGSLEGTHGLSVGACLHAGLERAFLDQVNRAAEQLGQTDFHARDVKQGYTPCGIERSEEINV
jgi:hypothetical protein